MNKSKEKGDQLEVAVESIERSLLERLNGAAYSIGRNETMIVDGARHEIDVVVKIMPNTTYESLHIYECKNLKSPVGKSVVSKFSDVINEVKAVDGKIIARTFSKDAKALAKKHPRIELIEFNDMAEGFIKCNHLSHQFTRFRAHLKFGDKFYLYGLPEARCYSCTYKGMNCDFGEFCHNTMNEWLGRFGAFNGPEGKFTGNVRAVFEFTGGELTISRLAVTQLILETVYEGSIMEARPTMAISIDKKGGFMKFDFDKAQFDGREVSLHVLGQPAEIQPKAASASSRKSRG